MSARHPASGAKTQDGAHAQRGADARNSLIFSKWHLIARSHGFFSATEMFVCLGLMIFFAMPLILAVIIYLSN